jgi:hypothetical protein
MLYAVHHCRGRLRVKSALLKGRPVRAEALRKLVLSMRGVASAQANPITGSVVVCYRPDLTSPKVIFRKLERAGYGSLVDGSLGQGGETSPSARLAKAVLGAAVEKLVERSARALLSALI